MEPQNNPVGAPGNVPTNPPITPPTEQQANPVPGPAQPYPQAPPASQPQSKTLSIVGFVLAILMPLIGLIISIIAFDKSKKSGKSDKLALAGIVIGIVFTIVSAGIIYSLMSNTSKVVQNKAKDTERKVDVDAIGSGIEQYVSQKGVFPETLNDLTTLDGFGQEALRTPEGGSYGYDVTPQGCNKKVTCRGYRIYTKGSNGETIERMNSLGS